MFSRSFRPISRAIVQRASLSTSTRTGAQATFRSRFTVIAATALTGTALVAYSGLERNVVHNDAPGPKGTTNWDSETAQYDEDLKNVNRHTAASEQGEKTPLSPIHNSATSESTVHISGSGETTKTAGKAAEVESVEPALHVVEKKAHEAEEEQAAGQQSAYNEETGEINWDCPCLGGMAHGPCGEDFRSAFSCFVYSEQEPKGVDCVEKFKAMQDCFRKHPDVYGAEIDDDEEDVPAAPAPAPTETTKLESEHSGFRDVPSSPHQEPPANSKIPDLTQENQASKGVQKLQPKGNKKSE